MEWEPFSIEHWAKALGMVNVPMFSTGMRPDGGDASVLLDGNAGSFAVASDPALIYDANPLIWAWSSYLRHVVFLNEAGGQVLVRRWDAPDAIIPFRPPPSPARAESFLRELASYRPHSQDVVSRMMGAFKALRASFVAQGAETIETVKAFNVLISALEKSTDWRDFESVANLGDLFRFLGQTADADLARLKAAYVGDAIDLVMNAAPAGLPPIDAYLMVRHASGQLFQEAHFELERPLYGQRDFIRGYAPTPTTRGTQQRDARYTPAFLARSIAEQVIGQLNLAAPTLTILDPACGSGVFLQEALRELERLKCQSEIELVGIDSSSVSVEFARFCLERGVDDARRSGLKVTVRISQANSLLPDCDWGTPDGILMNPPFVSYRDMSEAERDQCQYILSGIAKGHFDKAMAFIWKAAKSLSTNGAMATVVPSVLLANSGGERLRSEILGFMQLRTVVRFSGYGYFQGAMVEPAFVVMKARSGIQEPKALTFVIAQEGAEGDALRAMRKESDWSDSNTDTFTISRDVDAALFRSTNWMPQDSRRLALLRSLDFHPRVGDLFIVRQGALTGNNSVFVLDKDLLYERIPSGEREYFRPAAGTSTISKGRIWPSEFVFFPYNRHGLRLNTEEELMQAVPRYYEDFLLPHRRELSNRSDKGIKWWELIRARSWQMECVPKIVTAYFGRAGNFALDDSGEFVCLHGYAWRPVSAAITVHLDLDEIDDGDDEDIGVPFFSSHLPWAYVAILNSAPFSVLLSCFCQQMQGGQFNLSIRYIRDIPIPDLSGVPADLLDALADVGIAMSEGRQVDDAEHTSLASRAYGVPLSSWDLK